MPKSYTPCQLKPVIEDEENEQITFEVEAIVAHKTDPQTNKYVYKVKWVHLDSVHNTWSRPRTSTAKQLSKSTGIELTKCLTKHKRKKPIKRKYQIEERPQRRNKRSRQQQYL
ncbi:unnamed protein product [Rhizopus stolonifer]